MKKILPTFFVLLCFSVVLAPVVKAQNYTETGTVYKSRVPVNQKSGGVDVEHRSVWWGGKLLSWVVRLDVNAYDHYSNSSPRAVTNNVTTHYHIIGK